MAPPKKLPKRTTPTRRPASLVETIAKVAEEPELQKASVDFRGMIRLTVDPRIQVAADILKEISHGAAFLSGWWKAENGQDVRTWPLEYFRLWVGTKLALIVTEVSEAVEGYRKDKMDEHIPELPSLNVELADAVIRIFDLAGGLNIDLGEAIGKKLHYNSLRADHKVENRNAEGGKKF